MRKFLTVQEHYDMLIQSENDPPKLKAYMDLWDGETFWNLIQPTQGKRILEIGVGTGRCALIALSFGCKEFWGIDISEKTIERAKQHLLNYSNVKLVLGDILTTDFDVQFDTIYSTLTFFHIENKQELVKKISRLLYDQGQLIVSIEKDTEEVFEYDNYYVRMFPDTVSSISDILNKCGFKITDIREVEKANILRAVKVANSTFTADISE